MLVGGVQMGEVGDTLTQAGSFGPMAAMAKRHYLHPVAVIRNIVREWLV